MPLGGANISSVQFPGCLFEDILTRYQLHRTLINLTATPSDLLFPFAAYLEGFFEVQTFQQFLGNESPGLARQLQGLFYDIFRLWTHTA